MEDFVQMNLERMIQFDPLKETLVGLARELREQGEVI